MNAESPRGTKLNCKKHKSRCTAVDPTKEVICASVAVIPKLLLANLNLFALIPVSDAVLKTRPVHNTIPLSMAKLKFGVGFTLTKVPLASALQFSVNPPATCIPFPASVFARTAAV